VHWLHEFNAMTALMF